MKALIGFGDRNDSTDEIIQIAAKTKKELPVRSLVEVYFASRRRSYVYYNDQFCIRKDDNVFVTGAMAGEIGTVINVNTRFKINRADYQTVVFCVRPEIHGRFEKKYNMMVSYDNIATTPDEFRSWILPPVNEEAEIIVGDGYSVSLEHFEISADVETKITERGYDYVADGHVIYLHRNGEHVTAFVCGSKWYEVDFTYDEEDNQIRDLYCDCPYPNFCKHSVAALIQFRRLMDNALEKTLEGDETEEDTETDAIVMVDEKYQHFTAFDADYFWQKIAKSTENIVV